MTLERVEPGDPLSAANQNLLIEQVNMLSRPGASGEAHFGSDGIEFTSPPETRLALFELTSYVAYPNSANAPSDHFDRDPTPWAYARELYCHPFRSTDTNGNAAIRSYGVIQTSVEKTVWFPLAPRDPNGYAIMPPIAGLGARVLCIFNRQSARWEVVQGPPYYVACWGRLDERLNANCSAVVSLYWGGGDSGMNITAYDWLLKPGYYWPTQTRVKVEFFPQDGIWWVTAAEISPQQ